MTNMNIAKTVANMKNMNFEDIPENEALQRQLDHPFYKRAEEFRDEIKRETMEKAAKKYKEPFNPESWTIEQLAKHAMSENYDQQNYIFGMYERMVIQESRIKQLELLLQEAQLNIANNQKTRHSLQSKKRSRGFKEG